MTCAHVLGLIDAGPFADYPRAHLEAAWQHARQCASCGASLEAAGAMTSRLAAMAHPAPPPELAAGVMARIARIDERVPAEEQPARGRTAVALLDWPAWGTVCAAAAAAAVIADSQAPGIVGVPSLVLAAALGVYAAALFAPAQQNRRG